MISHNWKKFLLESIKNNPDKKEKVSQLKIQIANNEVWIAAMLSQYKEDYITANMNSLRSNAFSLGNNLLILWMISKYYWRSKKV
jgi:hypothetical protein